MFHAGFTNSDGEGAPFRPLVLKTFLKGVIAVAVFSVFLEINPNTIVNYLIFLVLALSAAAALSFVKRQTIFSINDDGIHVKRMFQKANLIKFENIYDISVAQGMLAKRFNCGTVFLILKSGRGSVRIMGGGFAEKLEDVRDPNGVMEAVSSRLSPFGQPG